MSDRNTTEQHRQPKLRRRRVLAATAALAGLAGCGGGGGGGGGDEGGNGGSGGGGPIVCSDLTNGYETYDSGETPFVFDLELPAAVLDSAEYANVGGIFELDAQSDWENGDTVEVTVSQNPNARREVRFKSTSDFMGDVKRSGTLSFNGEERPVWAPEATKGGGAGRTVELPYDVDGETLYFKADIGVDTGMAESTEECVTIFDEVAEHVVMSLRSNDDSTIASEMNAPE